MEAVFAHFDPIGEGEGSCTRRASSVTAHIKAVESSVSDLRWYFFRYYKKESVYVCGRKKEKARWEHERAEKQTESKKMWRAREQQEDLSEK